MLLEGDFEFLVLDLDDGLVEHADEHVLRQGIGVGGFLRQLHEGAGGQIAEEVRLALRSGDEQRGRPHLHFVDDLAKHTVERWLPTRIEVVVCGDQQFLAQRGESGTVLGLRKRRGDHRQQVLGAVGKLGVALERSACEGEAGVDERLGPRHGAGDIVVGTAVGNPAAEYLAVAIEDDRLGGGRPQVDADPAVHAAHPVAPAGCRRCSIICR